MQVAPDVSFAAVGIDGRDAVLATWLSPRSGALLASARRSPSGSFAPPVVLERGPLPSGPAQPGELQANLLEVNEAGRAALVFGRSEACPPGPCFGTTQTLYARLGDSHGRLGPADLVARPTPSVRSPP